MKGASLVALTIVLTAAGCGQANGVASTHEAVGTEAVALVTRHAPPISGQIAHPTCIHGEVRHSNRGGAIQFRAICAGKGTASEVAIMLARRVPGHPGRSVGIVAFGKVAKVTTTSPEHLTHRSRCQSRQGFVFCRVKVEASGRTILRGHAWIRQQRACSATMSVAAVESVGENIRSNQLFNGLPRGCS